MLIKKILINDIPVLISAPIKMQGFAYSMLSMDRGKSHVNWEGNPTPNARPRYQKADKERRRCGSPLRLVDVDKFDRNTNILLLWKPVYATINV